MEKGKFSNLGSHGAARAMGICGARELPMLFFLGEFRIRTLPVNHVQPHKMLTWHKPPEVSFGGGLVRVNSGSKSPQVFV